MWIGSQDDMLDAGQTANGLGERHHVVVRCTAGKDVNRRALYLHLDLLVACLTPAQLLKGRSNRDGWRRRMRMDRQARGPWLLLWHGRGREGKRGGRSSHFRGQQGDFLASPTYRRAGRRRTGLGRTVILDKDRQSFAA